MSELQSRWLAFKSRKRLERRARQDPPEAAAAEARWTRHNAEARAEGCKCGLPATHVRKIPVLGSVPFETYTCAEHINVNCWARSGDGGWVASDQHGYDSPKMRPWAGWVEPLKSESPDA